MEKKTSRFKSIFGYQDLTRNASPFVTMLIFMIPLLISGFVNNGMSLVNSIVLKNTVGGDSVTAINQTSPLSALILQFGFGCTSGFGVIIANLHGAKDSEKVKKAISLSIFICFLIWIVVAISGIAALKPLLNLLHVNEAYYQKAYQYFLVLLITYIFSLLSNLSTHILRALGNSFVVLIASFINLSCQIGVCYLLTSPHIGNLDTIGAGLATTTASIVNGVICFYFIFKKYPLNRSCIKYDKDITKDLIKLGFPLGLQWSILYIGTFVLASQINLYGVNASKGMAVYSSWEGLAINTIMGVFGLMMSNYVGQNYGVKNFKRIKDGIKVGYLMVFIIYAIYLAILLPTVRYIPYIYLPKEEVNERIMFYSSTYLYITISFSLFQGLINISRGALQGIKKPLFPFLSGIGELFARIGVSLLIPLIIDPNYHQTLSDASYVGISFSTGSAWFISFIIMGSALYILLFKNNKLNIIDNPTE